MDYDLWKTTDEREERAAEEAWDKELEEYSLLDIAKLSGGPVVNSPSRVNRMIIYDDGFFHKDDPSVRYRSYIISKDPKTDSPKPSQQRTIKDKVTVVTFTIWDRIGDFFRRVADAFMRLIGRR